jgi:hypothetical protein
MRPYWFAPFLFISLGILLLVCFAVDGVVINLAKFSTVAHSFPLSYWVKCISDRKHAKPCIPSPHPLW